MKKTLSYLILLTVVLAGAGAQEATTTVQVAPSDQVIYPDASQILNKTEPKVEPKIETPAPPSVNPAERTGTPSASPVVAATPVPARPLVAKPGAKALPPVAPRPAHGWFLKWTVTGDEAGVQAWAAARGANPPTVLGANLWEVLSGPLGPEDLKQALAGQAGQAQLVKR